jgi:hypothetical protein
VFRGDRVAGRFEILGEAKKGGMGTVLRALDRKDKREVAIKILNGEGADGAERFVREAQILAGLAHPNIVQYLQHGTADGALYLVMEWVEGETLADRLDRTGLDPRESVAVAVQLARALGSMHAAGVVHRDVKPANLMLVDRDVGRIKLLDFGVARRASERVRLTSTGALVGTAGYMSPEQARGDNEHVDARSDLFALGCVLHECLTGDAPFRSDNLLAAKAKVLVETPEPVRAFAPELPEALEALVDALLARRPERRPPDAAAVEHALGALPPLPASPPVPRAPHDRGWRADSGTATSAAGGAVHAATADARACAVLLSVDGPLPTVLIDFGGMGAEVDFLEGGLVVTLAGAPADAARIALRLAARFPDAVIAMIAGATIDHAIDASARLVEDLQVRASVDDTCGAGAWTDEATATAIAGAIDVARIGPHVRLVAETA